MIELERLGEDLRTEQDLLLEDGRRRLAVRNRLLARPAKRSRIRWALPSLSLGVVAALASIAVVLSQRTPSALSYEVVERPGHSSGQLVAAADRQVGLTFSDGSTVALNESSEARVDELSAEGATVHLARGRAELNVVHRETTRWQVQAGPYTVHVVGTRFAVAWEPSDGTFEVQMHEGRVLIDGPGFEGRALAGTEGLRINSVGTPETAPPVEVAAVRDDTNVAPVLALDLERSQQEPAAQERIVADDGAPSESEGQVENATTTTARRSPSWTSLARRGHPARALSVLGAPGFDRLLRAGTARRLMVLASTARRARDPRESQVYRALRSRFPSSPAATVAAFYLGRHHHHRGQYSQAASFYRAYLARAPRGTWADAATGRLMEALIQGGRRAQAQRVAQAYLQSFPEGAHRAYARPLAGR